MIAAKNGIITAPKKESAKPSCLSAWALWFRVTANLKEQVMSQKKLPRRAFLRSTLAVATAVPLGAIPLTLVAQDMVDENDPSAAALGYKANTEEVDAAKFPQHTAEQMCKNCQLFQGDGEAGGCAIFPGKQVAAKGWCSAWVKKAG